MGTPLSFEPFKGVIIEESLKYPEVLSGITITSTKVETVTDEHGTPWLARWTLHSVEIPAEEAPLIADEIRRCLDDRDNWYADFRNDRSHFVIFRERVFRIERGDRIGYGEVVRYGMSLGIPKRQLDFSPEVREWERSDHPS